MKPYTLTDPYPVAIYMDRYGGCYSGGGWIAYSNAECAPGTNTGAFNCDNDCQDYWAKECPCTDSTCAHNVGRGGTPQEALDDLLRRYAVTIGPAIRKARKARKP